MGTANFAGNRGYTAPRHAHRGRNLSVSQLAWSLLSPHLLAVVVALLSLLFAASVLRQRRPTGSAAAWLLLIFLVPYLGIPLFLSFGGRKMRRRANRKAPLRASRPSLPRAPSSEANEGSSPVIEWLADGVQAYRTFLEQIAQAQRSIRIQTFLLGNDATGRAMVDALIAGLGRGVSVDLLLDDLLAHGAPQDSLKRLVAAGGRVARFMPLLHVPFRGRANLRNHRKIALFDGERAIVGGMNLGCDYMGAEPELRFRDLSVLVGGAAVGALEAVFRNDWAFATGEEAPADDAAPPAASTPVVPSGPDAADDAIYDALLNALFRAERRFWVATPYFVPDEGLSRALEIAVRRGVDVRVLVPLRSNHRLADLAAAPSLRELQEAGGKVYRFLPGMLHAKAVLVDDTLAIVGSANFDMRSLFLDYEIALFFRGASEVARLGEWFEATLTEARVGAPQSSKPKAQLEQVCRMLSPLI